MRILIGTNNAHKVQEIRELLSDYQIVTPAEAGIDIDVEENGSTFEENATIKAKAFANVSHLLTLADDSGLQVDCLNGAPGIYSARYSPKPHATDADRRQVLLKNLHDGNFSKPWKARFYCAIAIVKPDGEVEMAHGTCEGEIIEEERGTGGFGYDPIFFVPNKGMTLSEMSEKEKNAISHRGNAIKNARKILKAIEANNEE